MLQLIPRILCRSSKNEPLIDPRVPLAHHTLVLEVHDLHLEPALERTSASHGQWIQCNPYSNDLRRGQPEFFDHPIQQAGPQPH